MLDNQEGANSAVAIVVIVAIAAIAAIVVIVAIAAIVPTVAIAAIVPTVAIAAIVPTVPIPNDTSSESSRRDVPNADLFATGTIPRVEISTMENRPRGV